MERDRSKVERQPGRVGRERENIDTKIGIQVFKLFQLEQLSLSVQ